jgi:REP element-mobilizing transposase RayT
MMVKAKTHGGKRPGAGRKKSGKKVGGPHRTRPALSKIHPLHVTLRVLPIVPRLRQRRYYEAVRRVLVRYLERSDFRVTHISIQNTHLHLLVEAAHAAALRRGMQSFAINAARAINEAAERKGKVFAYRYHASQIRTPEYAWHAVAYVLNNWRRHRVDARTLRVGPTTVDAYSSAVSFSGWSTRVSRTIDYEPLPVSPPRTGLLINGWEWLGRIPPDYVPGQRVD